MVDSLTCVEDNPRLLGLGDHLTPLLAATEAIELVVSLHLMEYTQKTQVYD